MLPDIQIRNYLRAQILHRSPVGPKKTTSKHFVLNQVHEYTGAGEYKDEPKI